MRAAVFDRFGPPDVLRIADLPDPHPGPGEVRVRVYAAGVQPFDTAVRRGDFAPVPIVFPQRVGQEYAGVVDEVGTGVGHLRVGDPVLGSAMLCAQATHVVVPAANAVPKPSTVDFTAAAALVAAAQTASGALRILGVKEGDVLLMHAAAGSVGTVAVQLARRAGATVIGTASPGNHDYLRELGAVPVEYGDGLVDAVRHLRPTVALDAAGGDAVEQSLAAGVAPERVGTIVGETHVVRAPRDPQRLAEVVALGLTMPVRSFALDDTAAAHAAVETRHVRGKVIVQA